jgi:hypothetical protein
MKVKDKMRRSLTSFDLDTGHLLEHLPLVEMAY